jgi:hypothetical protein
MVATHTYTYFFYTGVFFGNLLAAGGLFPTNQPNCVQISGGSAMSA